jgi:hypothetical protein
MVNLKDWFSEEQIDKAKSYQESYAQWFSKVGI